MDTGTLTLPIQATGRVDIGRLLREVEQVDNFLKQAAIREPGTTMKLPKTSRLLDELTATNKLNLLREDDRARLLNFLITVKSMAPVLHMSFSVDPSPSFVQKLMTWLRSEIHPLVLLQVGLQPNIGAGCVVRSTNQYFDFSLRQHFKKQRPLLMQKLHGDMQPKAPVAESEAEPLSPAQPAEPSSSVAEEAPVVVAPEAEAQTAPQPVQVVQEQVAVEPPREAPHG